MPIYSVQQAAELLGLKTMQVYYLIRSEKLTPIQLRPVLFDETGLEQYQQNEKKPKGGMKLRNCLQKTGGIINHDNNRRTYDETA